MKRKLLFICFTDDDCRLTHAMWWAKELHDHGHEVKILLEGLGTRCLSWLEDPQHTGLAKAFQAACEAGLIGGVCQAAASGCAGESGKPKPIDCAQRLNLPIKNSWQGHAGISEFVNAGFEIVTF